MNSLDSASFQGCQEDTDPFFTIPWPWSAIRTDDYGYNRLKVVNSTHLYFEYVSDVKVSQILEELYSGLTRQ
jgi:hypothetical protein